MREDLRKLFAAHSASPEALRGRFEMFYTDKLSICHMLQRPENEMPAFRHAHKEYEFLLPRTPIPFLLNDDAVYFGEVGYVFPVQSGRSHGVKHSLFNVSHCDIAINREYMDELMTYKGVAGVQFNYEFRVSNDLETCIDAFKREFQRGAQADRRKLRLLGELICLELITLGTDPGEDTRKEKHRYQKGIQSAAEYLNENYHRDVQLAALAGMYGFSKNYFIKVFKDSLGESPYSYLCKLRVSRAKLLLETTDEPVAQIAEKCGFARPNSFSTQFKVSTGVTPKSYREQFGRL